MHAHDNDNEKARQLIAAMQTLRLAAELSTAAQPAKPASQASRRP